MTLQKAYENRPCVNLAEHQLLDLCTGVVIIITLSMSNTHAKCTYGEYFCAWSRASVIGGWLIVISSWV